MIGVCVAMLKSHCIIILYNDMFKYIANIYNFTFSFLRLVLCLSLLMESSIYGRIINPSNYYTHVLQSKYYSDLNEILSTNGNQKIKDAFIRIVIDKMTADNGDFNKRYRRCKESEYENTFIGEIASYGLKQLSSSCQFVDVGERISKSILTSKREYHRMEIYRTSDKISCLLFKNCNSKERVDNTNAAIKYALLIQDEGNSATMSVASAETVDHSENSSAKFDKNSYKKVSSLVLSIYRKKHPLSIAQHIYNFKHSVFCKGAGVLFSCGCIAMSVFALYLQMSEITPNVSEAASQASYVADVTEYILNTFNALSDNLNGIAPTVDVLLSDSVEYFDKAMIQYGDALLQRIIDAADVITGEIQTNASKVIDRVNDVDTGIKLQTDNLQNLKQTLEGNLSYVQSITDIVKQQSDDVSASINAFEIEFDGKVKKTSEQLVLRKKNLDDIVADLGKVSSDLNVQVDSISRINGLDVKLQSLLNSVSSVEMTLSQNVVPELQILLGNRYQNFMSINDTLDKTRTLITHFSDNTAGLRSDIIDVKGLVSDCSNCYVGNKNVKCISYEDISDSLCDTSGTKCDREICDITDGDIFNIDGASDDRTIKNSTKVGADIMVGTKNYIEYANLTLGSVARSMCVASDTNSTILPNDAVEIQKIDAISGSNNMKTIARVMIDTGTDLKNAASEIKANLTDNLTSIADRINDSDQKVQDQKKELSVFRSFLSNVKSIINSTLKPKLTTLIRSISDIVSGGKTTVSSVESACIDRLNACKQEAQDVIGDTFEIAKSLNDELTTCDASLRTCSTNLNDCKTQCKVEYEKCDSDLQLCTTENTNCHMEYEQCKNDKERYEKLNKESSVLVDMCYGKYLQKWDTCSDLDCITKDYSYQDSNNQSIECSINNIVAMQNYKNDDCCFTLISAQTRCKMGDQNPLCVKDVLDADFSFCYSNP